MPDARPKLASSKSVRALRAVEREWIRKQARARRELAAAQRRRAGGPRAVPDAPAARTAR